MATGRDQNGRGNRRSKWDSPAPTPFGSATDAAHEAARKLNAMLAAKGKLTNTTPPLLPPKPKSTAGTNNDSTSNSAEMFSDEVPINDSPRRLLLCKGTVQYEINKFSGAAVSTKGQYIPPSEKASFEGQKPLSLFIQASSADKVQLAVKRIQGILNGDDPFSAPPIQTHHPFQASQSPALPSGMHYVQEKVFVGLDNVPPEFNLKEKIVGPGESYFQHITRETGAKIQLRGRGSGFLEPTSGREAFEALYVYISHNSYAGLGAAKKLVENLIQTVTSTYHAFQMQRSSNSHYSNYGGRAGPPHHPRMYMPPVPRYGIPHPHPNGTPSYLPYPHPQNQYPPRYNPPQQPPPNRHMHPNPSLPPRVPVLYPNQQPIHEGPRLRMHEQHPPHGGSYSSPTTRPPRPYAPTHPPVSHSSPHQEPPLSNNNRAVQQLPPSEISSEAGNKLNEAEDKKPPDPPKRRFTEAPAKKVVPSQPPSDSSADKQRSVSSLDQPSIPVSSSFAQDEGHRRTMSPPLMPSPAMPSPAMPAPTMLAPTMPAPTMPAPTMPARTMPAPTMPAPTMPAPTMPAPKVKPNNPNNPKKDNTTFSGGFKAPFLPISASVSTAKKNVQSPAVTAGSKRKHDESEQKSTGFALLGSYDDSSDEDEEEATRRLGSNRP